MTHGNIRRRLVMASLVLSGAALAAIATAQGIGETGWHRIVAGDTLDRIARSAGVETKVLIALNPGIRPDRLAAGRRIKVPCAPPLRPGTRPTGERREHVPAPDQVLRANTPQSAAPSRQPVAPGRLRPEGCPDI